MSIQSPGAKSYAVLVLSLVIAFASWEQGMKLEAWSELVEINNTVSLLGVLAASALAWLGKSPVSR